MLAQGQGAELIDDIKEKIAHAQRPLGLMLSSETLADLGEIPQDVTVRDLGSINDLNKWAAELFEVLRYFDQKEMATIIAEGCAYEKIGIAVMNRLTKACGGGEKV